MKFSDLYEELLAISLINLEECKKNKNTRDYLKELIIDFYNKASNNNDNNVKEEKIAYYDMWPIREVERIKFKVVRDPTLNTEQKMILYNNFSPTNNIHSLSQFKRIMIQRGYQ